MWSFFFFFNDTATPEIYTLSLHDALPIFGYGTRHTQHAMVAASREEQSREGMAQELVAFAVGGAVAVDRKSTRLNSSHDQKSYAVFCLKKKKREHRSRGCTD